jgi:uncharacterized protein (TIGR02271 family)
MPLHRIKDFDADYRRHFDNQDILGFDLYSGKEKVGSIDDLLVDDQGKFRYLVVNTGAWIFGKKIMLPMGLAHIDFQNHRVQTDGLTRSQVESLPEYKDNMVVDYDQEERLRDAYRPMATQRRSAYVDRPIAGNAPLEQSTSLEQQPIGNAPLASDVVASDVAAVNRPVDDRAMAYDRDTYSYDRDPDLYNLDEERHHNLRLYEERLIANKTRQKTGEVAVGKHVETETARVSVPLEKERIVIERTTPVEGATAIAPDAAAFNEGEVARVEVFEETPDIRKEAFVREEVRVRKEVDRKTVDAEDTIRREHLDINTQGNPVVEGPDRADVVDRTDRRDIVDRTDRRDVVEGPDRRDRI